MSLTAIQAEAEKIIQAKFKIPQCNFPNHNVNKTFNIAQ